MLKQATVGIIATLAVGAGTVLVQDKPIDTRPGLEATTTIQYEPSVDVIERDPARVFDVKPSPKTGVVEYAYFSDTEVPVFVGEDISQRTPFSWAKTEGKDRNGVDLVDGKKEVTIYAQGAFLKLNNGSWREIEFATTTAETYLEKKASTTVPVARKLGWFAFVETAYAADYYPDPNVETTTFDGFVQGGNVVWATVRALATANVTTNDTDNNQYFQATLAGGTYYIIRNALLFDTSAITDTDNIDSASLSLYIYTGSVNNDNAGVLHVVASNPASNTGIASGDFAIASWGSTSFGSINLSALTGGTYNAITLNASGLAAISKTGVSKLGNRMGHDLSDTAPGGLNQGAYYTADYTGTTRDPKLTVTTSAGSVPSATSTTPLRIKGGSLRIEGGTLRNSQL